MFNDWTSGFLRAIGALWSPIVDNYKEIGSVGGNWVQLVVGGGAVVSLIMRSLQIEPMMGQPLRSARREIRKKVRQILGSPDLKTMMKTILIDLEGRKTTAADILADWLNDPRVLYRKQQKAAREYHLGWKDISGALEDLMTWAAKPQKTGFLNRILIPVESRLLGQRFGEVATLARQFSRCQPVSRTRREHYPERDLAAENEESFRRFATAFSGAAVLVDTVQTRSRYAERALVWHSRQYFGGVGKESKTGNVEGWNTEPSDYGYEHGDRGCCLWRPEGAGKGDGTGIRPGGRLRPARPRSSVGGTGGSNDRRLHEPHLGNHGKLLRRDGIG